MASSTHTEVKRLVIGGRKVGKYDQAARLFIAEHEGELYATNSYWLAPAAKVAPLLDHFNLASDAAGSFEVNGQVRTLDQEPPNLSSIMPAHLGRELPVVERARVGDEGSAYAYQRANTGNYLALVRGDGGGLVAFNADFLHWLTYDGNLRDIPCGYGSRLVGDPIYRQAAIGKPMVISATREKQSGGNNGPDGKWIPATWSDDGELFLGLLMPVRV